MLHGGPSEQHGAAGSATRGAILMKGRGVYGYIQPGYSSTALRKYALRMLSRG